MPGIDDTVLLFPLLLLLLRDSDSVEMLDLEDLPDSEPDFEADLALDPAGLVGLLSVLDVRPDLAVRPVLELREEISETSECLDESLEIEESLVLEVRSDALDRAVVDLLRLVEVFCSTSDCALIVTTTDSPPHRGLHTDHR